MADLLKFSIPGKPEYVQMVRLAIGSIAGKANYDMEAVEDIKVAVAEACKNIFCHGQESFLSRYEIACEINKEDMRIDVTDTCDGPGPKKFNKPCDQCPDEGNLGVAVIESLMDEVTISIDEHKKKRITMVKNR